MNNPLYERAQFPHLCLNGGITVVALKSKAEIGSPKYRILLGLVLVSDEILLAKSVDNSFLPMSTPIPVNKPPPLKPIALSIVPPVANPPAAPTPTISFLTMFFIMDLTCYLIQLEHRMS